MAGEPRIGVVCVWLAAVADFVGAGGRVILAEAGGAFVVAFGGEGRGRAGSHPSLRPSRGSIHPHPHPAHR